MRVANGMQLLDLVREKGPVSRAALAKLSGLSKPTVSEQVKWLLGRGVVVEVGAGEATPLGGKKPTLVDFHVDAGRVIAVSVEPAITRLRCTNLRGVVQREASFGTNPARGCGAFLDRLRRAIAAIADGDVKAVAVGTPGRVDCDRGIIIETDNVFGWKNVDVRAAVGGDVLVDNDVKLALTAEMARGCAVPTAVLIRLGVGIGAAVAIGGKVHHGAHWAAGELSLLTPAPTRRRDPRGYLESVLGSDRIARRVRAVLKGRSGLPALFSNKRHPQAKKIVDDLAWHLHLAVASQVLAYDPDVVLVSGELFDYMLDDVRRLVRRSIPWPVDIQKAHLGEDAVLRGATHAALDFAYQGMTKQLQPRARTAYA